MRNKREVEEFQEAAIKRDIHKWDIHECSMCGYMCGYLISNNFKEIAYDSGCDCVHYHNINHVSWDEIANHYNIQSSEKYIQKMNEFWGFND